MESKRVFLDWNKAFLQETAQYLSHHYQIKDQINLSKQVLVLPGSRAGRRLTELLVAESEKLNKILLPPKIITTGSLAEEVTQPQVEFISDFERKLIWFDLLQSLSSEQISLLGIKNFEVDSDLVFVRFASVIDKLYLELSGAGLRFSDVPERLEKFFGFNDRLRWEALANLEERFKSALEQGGVYDKHQHRFNALLKSDFSIDKEILLLACFDLEPIVRKILAKLTNGYQVLIHASKDLEAAFDEYGCIEKDFWFSEEIEIDDSKIAISEAGKKQVYLALNKVAGLTERYTQEDISLGVLDDSLVPFYKENLYKFGIEANEASGLNLSETSVFKALKSLHRYLKTKSIADYFSFLRSHDLSNYLVNELNLNLVELFFNLDSYQSEHLQADFEGKILGSSTKSELLKRITERTDELIKPLRKGEKGLAEWADIIFGFLESVYGSRSFDLKKAEENITFQVLEEVYRVIVAIKKIQHLENSVVSSSQALQMIIQELSTKKIQRDSSKLSLDLVGWLELQLDDAKALIISGFNEGFVPKSLTNDIFLPNSIREHLSLLDNERRLARDSYILSAILNSREDVQLTLARRNSEGAVLLPSRLLYKADKRKVAKRVSRFFSANSEAEDSLELKFSLQAGENAFQIPQKPKYLPKETSSLSVTSFKDYLFCPYYFYLRHILRLKDLDDSELELNPLQFGNLIHDVLENFANSEVRESSREEEISQFLQLKLLDKFKNYYGERPQPAVLVQYHQLIKRLSSFAKWQSEWRKAGWSIKHSEFAFGEGEVELRIDNESKVSLLGRIDRIDYNSKTNSWAVLDYKTGDIPFSPEEAHRTGATREWINLQLPLYGYMLKRSGICPELPQLGYVLISSSEDVKEEFSDWSEQEVIEAVSLAAELSKQIKDNIFWPTDVSLNVENRFAKLYGVEQYLEEGLE